MWTLSGLGPVESLRTGDQVLTQDPDSGDLSYRPVLAIRHGMRQPIKTLAIGIRLRLRPPRWNASG